MKQDKYQAERARFVENAKEAKSLYDSLFYITYYNSFRHRWASEPRPNPITGAEIGLKMTRDEYSEVMHRVLNLLDRSSFVGAAYHQYQSTNETFEEACERMKIENPGFSNHAYELACNKAIFEMR